jgi:type I restriction enzyme, S subunit
MNQDRASTITNSQLKEGYKQTEVGIIPEDWEVRTVTQLIEDGIIEKPMDGNHGNIHPKSGDFVELGIPFIMANDVKNGVVDLNNCSFIRKKQADSLQKGFSLKGDVLLTHKATIGNTAVVGSIPTDYIMLTPQVTYYRVANSTQFNNLYLRHYFDGTSFQKILAIMAGGGTRSYIGITAQRQLPIVVPPLPEQEAIACTLSDIDALIESLDRLLTKKRQIKQGAMQELLRSKDGWIEKKLGKTATLKARIGWQGLTTAEYLDLGDFHLVTGTEFKNGFIDWNNCHFVEESRYKQDKNIQLKVDDVLVTKDGTIGKVAIVDCLKNPATLNSGVFVIRPVDNSFHPKFFYYLLCSNLFNEFLSQLSAGSTINHLYQKDFINFVYQVPKTLEEQIEIANILSDMDAEIGSIESKLTKTRQLKQGMMHELLTGRIRLVD